MPTNLIATGFDGNNLERIISNNIRRSNCPAIGLAVAYVSIYGAHFLKTIVARLALRDIKIVTDTGDAITHPQALRLALSEGWQTRIVKRATGTFHPKLLIGGQRFNADVLMEETTLLVIGSANLSKMGLKGNVECSLVRTYDAAMPEAASVFRRLWELGEDLTNEAVDAYEIDFAERNRVRSAKDLETVGVADEAFVEVEGTAQFRTRKQPKKDEQSMSTNVAAAAWTGLESFTGEYRFQIEFPRNAGDVLRRILEPVGGEAVEMVCEDEVTRHMKYKYYEDNAMFRLNVPNDTPGVEWARENHTGIAVVEAHPEEGVPLRFRIIGPGRDAKNILGRSVALGTWGKTRTRLYGWY